MVQLEQNMHRSLNNFWKYKFILDESSKIIQRDSNAFTRKVQEAPQPCQEPGVDPGYVKRGGG